VIVAVAATAHVAIPTLQWLLGSPHTLLRVITTPDSKSGRGKVLTPSPVAQWAQTHGVSLFKPDTDEQMREAFTGADLVIAIAYGRILKKSILDIPARGFLNLHFSLLPAYRGAAPVQRAIGNGETITGISIFAIDENLDTGPIYLQRRYEIPMAASSDQVLEDLSKLGATAFEEVFKMIEESVVPTIQNSLGASNAPKISKEEARINWNQESAKILNSVRAYTSSPGAWTLFRGSSMKITSANFSELTEAMSPGALHLYQKRVFVGTKDLPIEILRIIPSGKQEMSVTDWTNGARINEGEVFE
jgi:methionyl-tRNA formyltransferase